MNAPRVYPEKTRKVALVAVGQGLSRAEVGRQLGISSSTIEVWCRSAGMPGQKGRPRVFTADEVSRARELREAGMSKVAIGRQLHVNVKLVAKWVKDPIQADEDEQRLLEELARHSNGDDAACLEHRNDLDREHDDWWPEAVKADAHRWRHIRSEPRALPACSILRAAIIRAAQYA